ncbi:MAG: trigger factor [Flavobacterium sp.]
MNITKNQLDALNAVVTINLTKDDYADKVQKVLLDYRKNANIPGFRKGSVPMGMIQKQYGKAVLLDEVNKVLQENLNKYINQEKLEILGNPLPIIDENLDLDAETLSFSFEIGLSPEFSIDLGAANNLKSFKVIADDEMLNEQVLRIQKQYGKRLIKSEVEKTDEVKGTFVNEAAGINKNTSFSTEILNDEVFNSAFASKQVGDVLELSTIGLFKDDHQLMTHFDLDHDGIHDLDIKVTFTIESITNAEPAELNQEFFDKLFGEGVVTSLETLKARIKEDAEAQFAQQADQKFYNDVTAFLLESTKFDLPKEFLIKWLQTAGERQLTAEEATEEFEKSENGLRYQLIEGKVIRDFNLQVTFEELKDYVTGMIKKQMAQFGQMDPSDDDVKGIVARVMSNQDEIRKISEQLLTEKMLHLFKTEVKTKEEEVNYEQFVKEMYGE